MDEQGTAKCTISSLYYCLDIRLLWIFKIPIKQRHWKVPNLCTDSRDCEPEALPFSPLQTCFYLCWHTLPRHTPTFSYLLLQWILPYTALSSPDRTSYSHVHCIAGQVCVTYATWLHFQGHYWLLFLVVYMAWNQGTWKLPVPKWISLVIESFGVGISACASTHWNPDGSHERQGLSVVTFKHPETYSNFAPSICAFCRMSARWPCWYMLMGQRLSVTNYWLVWRNWGFCCHDFRLFLFCYYTVLS